MTLVEVMVTILIISLVTTVTGVFLWGAKIKAERRTAKIQIHQLGEALLQHRLDLRRFPTADEGLAGLTVPRGGEPPIMERIPTDPWGRAYVYTVPGEHNPASFDLTTTGPDGIAGNEDDVNNWEPINGSAP